MNTNCRNALMSVLALIATMALLLFSSCVEYRKMNPPADADKPGGAGVDNSCYLATAANMLAGAGYGDGANLQARADDIYNDLTTQFGIANGGWTDVALNWWLSSANNTWTTNPYTIVTVYGNKSPKNPWANASGTQFYGNELRRCCFVGLSISWPAAGAQIGSGGHAITSWGDSFGNDPLTVNATNVAVTDSDTDTGGNEQEYTYDTYTAPNPGGANEGNGWYMNYSNNHPYIKHIITLCPTDDPTDHVQTQKVTGSYRLPQNSKESATDLHYTVSTDVEILSYKTWIDWETENNPVITESGSPRNRITVDWDLSDNPVPSGKEVTINTEFILPTWNAMSYSDVYWTYPVGSGTKPGKKFTEIRWKVETPLLQDVKRLPNNVTGGFLIGSFELISFDENKNRIILPYRFVHEYSYNQRPDQHLLQITGNPPAMIQNLRIGNSWNYPESNELWRFNDWLTTYEKADSLGREPLMIKLDWTGKVPYPEGENIYKAIPDIDGKPRQPDKN
jgi:hypothetical protein